MTCHTHECEACGEHYLCSAPLEENVDGWPNPVCVTRKEANEQYRRCTECNAGRLMCDSGCGRRGTWNEDLGETICDDCTQNQAEAAHERMLSDFYGGSGPVTMDERMSAAAKVDRDLRRLD